MFKKIVLGVLITLALLIVGIVVIVALQPEDYRVERKIKINASPEAVFAHANDFRSWQQWSPWEKLDPKMERTFEGPATGTGSIYKWSGNENVGKGKMTILESKPNELVKIKLEFSEPFEASSMSEFAFKPDGNQTEVTWVMYGKNGFVHKAVHLVFNMSKQIGNDYEKGLANLKEVVEKK